MTLTDTRVPAVLTALQAVMDDVREIAKRDRNTQQNYSFRGVDAVVNAIGPALRAHKIIVRPELVEIEYGVVEVGSDRRRMTQVKITMRYVFTSTEDGSEFAAEAPGEAFDAGDKATPKATSVAYRTAMLQTFCIPTDEPEPDAQAYHQSPGTPPAGAEVETILERVSAATDEDVLNRAARLAATYYEGEKLGVLREAIQGKRAELRGGPK